MLEQSRSARRLLCFLIAAIAQLCLAQEDVGLSVNSKSMALGDTMANLYSGDMSKMGPAFKAMLSCRTLNEKTKEKLAIDFFVRHSEELYGNHDNAALQQDLISFLSNYSRRWNCRPRIGELLYHEIQCSRLDLGLAKKHLEELRQPKEVILAVGRILRSGIPDRDKIGLVLPAFLPSRNKGWFTGSSTNLWLLYADCDRHLDSFELFRALRNYSPYNDLHLSGKKDVYIGTYLSELRYQSVRKLPAVLIGDFHKSFDLNTPEKKAYFSRIVQYLPLLFRTGDKRSIIPLLEYSRTWDWKKEGDQIVSALAQCRTDTVAFQLLLDQAALTRCRFALNGVLTYATLGLPIGHPKRFPDHASEKVPSYLDSSYRDAQGIIVLVKAFLKENANAFKPLDVVPHLRRGVREDEKRVLQKEMYDGVCYRHLSKKPTPYLVSPDKLRFEEILRELEMVMLKRAPMSLFDDEK